MNNMKVFFLMIVCLCVTRGITQSVPPGIPYQAVVRNMDGSVAANANLTARFTLHQNTTDGVVEFQETHPLVSNAQGLVSAVIGQGTAVQSNFSSIVWSNTTKFLQVEMDLGNGYVDLGTQQLMSVPFAMYAASGTPGPQGPAGPIGETGPQGPAINLTVSQVGDTLFTGNGFIIIPGISSANNESAVSGCMDPSACNYNGSATVNDNTCLYFDSVCNDGNSSTINDVVNQNCVCQGILQNTSGLGLNILPQNTLCQNEYISVSGCNGDTLLNYFGHDYRLTEIGGQCWFAENLATAQYSNGDFISTPLTSGSASYSVIPQDTIYGYYYNFFVVADLRNVCPAGWHVPTDCDWMFMENALGLPSSNQVLTGNRGTTEGGQLKSLVNWYSPNLYANNNSGFSGYGGGYKSPSNQGNPTDFKSFGYWWTSTPYSSGAWTRSLSRSNGTITRSWLDIPLFYGINIRCIKD